MVPLAALCGAYVKTDDNLYKPADGPIYHFTWPIMFIWDNFEDGIANKNYYVAPNMFLQIVYWSCLRNPANNLRIVPYLSLMINRDKVHFIGSLGNSDYFRKMIFSKNIAPNMAYDILHDYDTEIPHWFFAWQGIYSNFYWHFHLFGKLRRFWIGWKIYPTDIVGGPYGYRDKGAGFALQFKVVK
jgi:hypothetical protein